MPTVLKLIACITLSLIGVTSGTLSAAEAPDFLPVQKSVSIPLFTQGDLDDLQERFDSLKQQVSATSDYSQLAGLQDSIHSFIDDADQVASLLLPKQTQTQSQLNVLGAPPTDDAVVEKPVITEQRLALTEQKNTLDNDLKKVATLKEGAAKLVAQIASIRRGLLETELILRTDSVLTPRFWSPVFSLSSDDQNRLKRFTDQLQSAFEFAWQPGQNTAAATLLILALAIWVLGRRLAESGLTWLCIHQLPEGRLRRSALALATTLASLLAAGCAFQLAFFVLTRQQELTPVLQNFFDNVEKLVYIFAQIIGLSRALLSTRHPSWRLPAIADPVALAIKPFPNILAVLLLILMTLVQVISVTGMSFQITLFARGVVALVVTVVIGALLLRTNSARRAMVASGESPEARTTLAGVIYAIVGFAIVVSFLALLTGYISLARFITYELVWIYIILTSFYLLTQLLKDTCDYVFFPKVTAP